LGIADESIRFSENEKPNEKEVEKILSYNLNGEIIHIGDNIAGNKEFKAGDRIALEINMKSNPRTLTFFINDREQLNYISRIPSSVRFYAHLSGKSSSFKILIFERLSEPSADHEAGAHSFDWGKE
ncbi:MAG: hypothetical protein EZS28_050078, partial [Streblomastix strix]